MGLSQQAFNIMKNAVLSHPFEVTPAKYSLLRKLFTDLLFLQTYDVLTSINKGITENPGLVI
jgi:ssDNA-specific exonuclease RecJ